MTSPADRQWFAAVAQIPQCVLCGGTEDLQVAHCNQDRGKGQKAAASETARLCRKCHHEIDNGPNLTQIERRYWMERALRLTKRWLITLGLLTLQSTAKKRERKYTPLPKILPRRCA